MLSKFSVSNFLSIKNELEISFNHSYSNASIFKDNILFEYYDNARKRAILNGSLLLGANASGKTNVLIGLRVMREYFLNSVSFLTPDDIEFPLQPYAFDDNPISTFKIEFVTEITEQLDHPPSSYFINYEFSFDHSLQKIKQEVLYYRKVLKTKLDQPVFIFKRLYDVIESSLDISRILEKIKQENITHKLVLSLILFDINKTFYADEVSTLSFNLAEICGQFLNRELRFDSNGENLNEFTEALNKNEAFKQYILQNLTDFDFALANFHIQDVTDDIVAALSTSNAFAQMPTTMQKKILNDARKNRQYRIETIHQVGDNNYTLSMGLESSGTRKFLANSLHIYESILYGGLYVSDEFESHYHFRLQEGIINNFLNEGMQQRAQFLLVTHNPFLLNPDFFAKEQIYFVDKDRETESTIVFSLKEFEGITYNNHNWSQLYMKGKFGAVPEVIF
ncbi:ATP-binding protein [Paenibacillus campi]|uniref:AAA family ATPase n=1 Tax=Paenibacillus campi TaxID=3106031 RepID=UPI002AFFF3D0|nr:ATP-binding protein [Paenibacillus sp. SGZ-1009]